MAEIAEESLFKSDSPPGRGRKIIAKITWELLGLEISVSSRSPGLTLAAKEIKL